MNVLLCCPWSLSEIGGVTRVVTTLAQGLVRRGHQVTILVPQWEGFSTEDHEGLRVLRIGMREVPASGSLKERVGYLAFYPLTLVRLWWVLSRFRVEVVDVHYFTGHWDYFRILRMLKRFRLYVSLHGADVLAEGREHRATLLRRWLPVTSRIVFCSETLRQQVSPAVGDITGLSTVVLNGVPLQGLPATPSPRARRITCVAILRPSKGQDVLIRAFALISAEFPEVELELIGTGPTEEDLKELSRQLGIRERVTFRGPLGAEDVAGALWATEVFCLPSRREGLPLAMLEAMAAGACVVATRTVGIPEAIEDGVHGILVEQDDVEGLGRALSRVLGDENLRNRLASAGQRRYQLKFSVERFLLDYERVLSDPTSLGEVALT